MPVSDLPQDAESYSKVVAPVARVSECIQNESDVNKVYACSGLLLSKRRYE